MNSVKCTDLSQRVKTCGRHGLRRWEIDLYLCKSDQITLHEEPTIQQKNLRRAAYPSQHKTDLLRLPHHCELKVK